MRKRTSYIRRLELQDFEGTNGMVMKDVAYLLRRPYSEVRRRVFQLGIRDRFPAHGGEAFHLAKRGYNG